MSKLFSVKKFSTWFVTLVVLFSFGSSSVVEAAVKVKGYYRSDGTYVQPHYRSNPNANPYNNWSYPGNTNPYTGKTAAGNSDTYLKNYDSAASSGATPSFSPTIDNQPQKSIAVVTPPMSDTERQTLIEELKRQIIMLQLQLQIVMLQNQITAFNTTR